MKSIFILLFTYVFLPVVSLLSVTTPLKTDRVIFLFDNGDKNMVASMLKYAEVNDKSTLDSLNFHIIFMGASIDSIDKEPFSHYPDRMVHYKELGIEETIDHQWKREEEISAKSIANLFRSMILEKKIWTGVSCSIFKQLIEHYQTNPNLEVLALRDNPSPDGDTDYFKVAREVQGVAHKIALPSKAICGDLDYLDKEIAVIGHGPIEEWQEEAEQINKEAIFAKLGLDPLIPVVVYAGVYGDTYQESFERFLGLLPDVKIQVLIVPHPRYQGAIETKLCENLAYQFAKVKLVGEFVNDPSHRIKTVEAIAIGDLVITADATSTIVFHANALKKKVLYINKTSTKLSRGFSDKKLISPILDSKQFLEAIKDSSLEQKDVFTLLEIPKNGAKLLWDEFVN